MNGTTSANSLPPKLKQQVRITSARANRKPSARLACRNHLRIRRETKVSRRTRTPTARGRSTREFSFVLSGEKHLQLFELVCLRESTDILRFAQNDIVGSLLCRRSPSSLWR